MEIQIADQRPPLTVAIGHAKKQGERCLPTWQAEMTQMVVEVTRKFHGSITSENVARGLETTVGILSLGLMHATGGAPDAAAWVQHLQLHGIRKLSAQVVEKVRQIVDLPTTDYLNPNAGLAPTAREQLLYFAREGYDRMRADEAKRRRNLLQIDLARWLMANTSVGPSARRSLSGDLKDIATVDDVYLYILPRLAQIPLKYLPGQINLDEESFDDDFDRYEEEKIKLPPAIWKEAKKCYDEFVATLPEALKPALTNEGLEWFDAHIHRTSAAALREKKERVSSERISLEELDALAEFEAPIGHKVDEAEAFGALLEALKGVEPIEKKTKTPAAKKPATAKKPAKPKSAPKKKD